MLLLALSHNLQSILLGVSSLGVAAGLLGCFLLFRKRSLLSDTVGHSILPGVTFAFLISSMFSGDGKAFAALAIGGLIFGWLSVWSVQFLTNKTPIRQDGALAITLTVFYGLGVVLLSVIQSSGLPNASGLEYYLYGMVASMIQSEAYLLSVVAFFALVIVFIFFKELNVLCFDEQFTTTQGLPRRWLDELLMFVCLVVAIVGLQTVGLLLLMALFIIPPATARLWTNSLPWTLAIAGIVGGSGAVIGAIISARVPHLPAGAAIILAIAALFFISLVIGRRKGWLVHYLQFYQLENQLAENQFLRATFDNQESQQQVRLFCGLDFSKKLALAEFEIKDILKKREWSFQKKQKTLLRLSRQGLVEKVSREKAKLTSLGLERAIEAAKTHRLTELYLLEYAEIAPKKVHQYVEKIEEITTPGIAQDLRDLFEERLKKDLIPPEPHEIHL